MTKPDLIGGPTTVVKELERENRALRAYLTAARAERDELAKALRELADMSLNVERVPLRILALARARSDALRGAARAALAALPPEEDGA